MTFKSSPKTDDLGDRMKLYEQEEAGRKLNPGLPVLCRIDGRGFSKFTRGMERPSSAFHEAMVATTRSLVEETNACMGYTQSDEITLSWAGSTPETGAYFGDKIQKITSAIASHATLKFYLEVLAHFPDYAPRAPTFDVRVWNVPNRTEGANAFLWRQWDATKNAVSMAASLHYGEKTLHGKNGLERREMLKAKGVDFEEYPDWFKLGTFVQRRKVVRGFTAEELSVLPPKHQAHTDPALMVERTQVRRVQLPELRFVTNREEVLYEGQAPEVPHA